MIGVAYRDPSWAEEMCLYLLSQQYEDGHAAHACYPEDGHVNFMAQNKHADDHLWMPWLFMQFYLDWRFHNQIK